MQAHPDRGMGMAESAKSLRETEKCKDQGGQRSMERDWVRSDLSGIGSDTKQREHGRSLRGRYID